MEKFVWSEKFSVDHEVLDRQHRMLVEWVNRFDDTINSEVTKEDTIDIFKKLVSYTKYHFAYEEKVLEEINYPDLQAQKDEHREFKRKLLECIKQAHTNHALANREVLGFVREWIYSHIMGDDRKYIDYI